MNREHWKHVYHTYRWFNRYHQNLSFIPSRYTDDEVRALVIVTGFIPLWGQDGNNQKYTGHNQAH